MTGASADIDRAPGASENDAGNRSRDGMGHQVRRIGEPVEEITAFERRAQSVNDVAVRRQLGVRRRLKPVGLVLVVEADHGSERELRLPGLDLLPRGRGRRLQMEHRDAVDDREDAALTAQDAVLNLVVGTAMEQRRHHLQPPSTVGTA